MVIGIFVSSKGYLIVCHGSDQLLLSLVATNTIEQE